MSDSVLDMVQGALGPEVLRQAADRLGEEPAALSRFIGAGVPAVLTRLTERGRVEGGAETLLVAMRRTGAGRALADPLARLEPGAQPDPELVGGDLSDRLGRFAGVSEGSAAALVAMLIPLSLGAVARIAPTPLTPLTLGRTLREQEEGAARALPTGLDLRSSEEPTTDGPTVHAAVEAAAAEPAVVSTPFLEPVADTAPPQPVPIIQPPVAMPDATDAKPAGAAGSGLTRWLLIGLALLMLLALLWVLMGNLGAGDAGRSPAEPAGSSRGDTGTPPPG